MKNRSYIYNSIQTLIQTQGPDKNHRTLRRINYIQRQRQRPGQGAVYYGGEHRSFISMTCVHLDYSEHMCMWQKPEAIHKRWIRSLVSNSSLHSPALFTAKTQSSIIL